MPFGCLYVPTYRIENQCESKDCTIVFCTLASHTVCTGVELSK